MRVGDVMTTKVETVGPDESAEDARSRMQALRVHHLVVTEGKAVVGVISDRDLDAPEGKKVSELMSAKPVTITARATVRDAANELRGNVIGCLPVLDDDRLVGIITTTDLLDLIGRGAERPIEVAKRWTLRHRGPRKDKVRRPR